MSVNNNSIVTPTYSDSFSKLPDRLLKAAFFPRMGMNGLGLFEGLLSEKDLAMLSVTCRDWFGITNNVKYSAELLKILPLMSRVFSDFRPTQMWPLYHEPGVVVSYLRNTEGVLTDFHLFCTHIYDLSIVSQVFIKTHYDRNKDVSERMPAGGPWAVLKGVSVRTPSLAEEDILTLVVNATRIANNGVERKMRKYIVRFVECECLSTLPDVIGKIE